MTTFVAEIIGTAILMLLGDGVVANTVLRESKGYGAGWGVICKLQASVAARIRITGGLKRLFMLRAPFS